MEMSRTYTGALILIERNTRLDELMSQENVVTFDSEVTSSVLQSVFYKGSPMHDGGLLIRDGRIVAARCHVPLSVTMHSLERAGTRHRAAVGASEMGDTVAVVVSEERGKTSIAVNGRLFEMRSAKELEANLSYLLGIKEYGNAKKGFFGKLFGKKDDIISVEPEVLSQEDVAKAASKKKSNSASSEPIVATTQVEVAGESSVPITIRTQAADQTSNSKRVSVSTRILFLLISIFMSLILWVYIQINTNPVVKRNITVPINSYDTTELPENYEVSFPIRTIDLEIVGRASTINSMTADDIIATVDYSQITVGETGVVELPVTITAANGNVYFRVESQMPERVSVTVYSRN